METNEKFDQAEKLTVPFAGLDIIEENGQQFVQLHGHKVKVASEEECSKCDFSVHARVDKSIPQWVTKGSEIDKCSRCKEDIWRSPSTPKTLTPLCMECAIKKAEEETVTE